SGGRRSFFEAGVPGAANAAAVELLLRRAEVDVRERPQLWVIDDAHLAGRGALAWLTDLPRSDALPIGGGYGPHDPERAPLAGEPTVQLAPLTSDEVVALLTAELGAPPSPGVIAALGDAGGMPLAITAALATIDPDEILHENGLAHLSPERLADLA